VRRCGCLYRRAWSWCIGSLRSAFRDMENLQILFLKARRVKDISDIDE
jgi:hypothetical protein